MLYCTNITLFVLSMCCLSVCVVYQNELVEPLLSGLFSHPLPDPADESLSVQPSGSPDAPVS